MEGIVGRLNVENLNIQLSNGQVELGLAQPYSVG